MPLAKVGGVTAGFQARSKLSRMGRTFLMTSAAANSRNSCCSRTARLRALSNPPAGGQAIEQCVAFAFSCSVSDAAAFSAAMPTGAEPQILPRLPLPEARAQDQRSLGFSVSLTHAAHLLRFIQKVCRTAARYTTPPTWCADNPAASAQSRPATPSLRRRRAPERQIRTKFCKFEAGIASSSPITTRTASCRVSR